MPVVKVTDLAYCRLQSPNLDEAQEFLTRFSMTVSARTQDRLFMRGRDGAPVEAEAVASYRFELR